jgi:tyrosine-specific transport protein
MISRTQIVLAASLLLSSSQAFQTPKVSTRNAPSEDVSKEFLSYRDGASKRSRISLRMQPSSKDDAAKRRIKSLKAVSIGDDWDTRDKSSLSNSNFLESSVMPVLSTSLMITGNTVGAGMLVLPELAAGPGMGVSTSLFVGAFLVNLLSGLLIAEVAINQHDSSGSDVSSSFKEFAEVSLNSHTAANVISGISVFVNALVLAFNTVKVGDVGAATLQGMLPSDVISMAWAVACVGLVGSQSFTSLSTITSLMVSGLFVSFAGLLLPGLANMPADPMTIFMAPGTSTDVFSSACQLAPIILMSLVYQNIVPTVTKMLNYDRTKTGVAISLGSFLPLGMYIAWAFAVVGGGVDTSVGMGGPGGPLMTMFSLTTIAGSSIGCVMSLSEEFDTYLKPKQEDSDVSSNNDKNHSEEDDKFSLPAVVASVGCAWGASQFFASDLNEALKVAGSFGSPLLYGVLPVVMAYTQREKISKAVPRTSMQLPTVSLGLLGVASTGFVGNELLQSAQDAMTMVSL